MKVILYYGQRSRRVTDDRVFALSHIESSCCNYKALKNHSDFRNWFVNYLHINAVNSKLLVLKVLYGVYTYIKIDFGVWYRYIWLRLSLCNRWFIGISMEELNTLSFAACMMKINHIYFMIINHYLPIWLNWVD